VDIKDNTKTFIKFVNSLMEKGEVSGFAEIADKLSWSRTSMTSVLKGRRNVPKDVYRRFTEVYKIDQAQEPPTDKDAIISLLRQNNKLLEDQVNLATGELRHIAVMNFAMLKTMRKAVAQILARAEKSDLLEVSGRLDKETAVFYRSIRERGSLIDLGI
jgi:hypothetical protein